MKTSNIEAFEMLKKFKKNGFIALISLVAEDLSPNTEGENEFKLTYTLYNPVNREFKEFKTTVNDTACSVSSLYKSANYDEREIYDLFGIKFKNHPNLKRIFLDENFKGHPLKNCFKSGSQKRFTTIDTANNKE